MWRFALILLCCAVVVFSFGTVRAYLKVISYPAFYQTFNTITAPVYRCKLEVQPGVFLHYDVASQSDVELVKGLVQKWYAVLHEVFNELKGEGLHVIVCSDREALRRAVPFFRSESSSLGVYQTGRIYLLAPSAWLWHLDTAEIREVYSSEGPVLHEMVHWAVDVVTRGNCPLWFNEGIAQYMEKDYQGYEWKEADVTASTHYGIDELHGGFASLDNQALAYRQALLLVDFLVHQYGFERLQDVLRHMARGWSLDHALRKTMGITLTEWQDNWLDTLEDPK